MQINLPPPFSRLLRFADNGGADHATITDGKLHVILAMGLRSWLQGIDNPISPQSTETFGQRFDRLRGTRAFANALYDFVPDSRRMAENLNNPFVRVEKINDRDRIVTLGYNIAAFRAALLDDQWMMRTYTIDHEWFNLEGVDLFSRDVALTQRVIQERLNLVRDVLKQFAESAKDNSTPLPAQLQLPGQNEWLKWMLLDACPSADGKPVQFRGFDERKIERVAAGMNRLMAEHTDQFSNDDWLLPLWLSFNFHIRLSRLGLIELRLEQNLPQTHVSDGKVEAETISGLLERLLQMRTTVKLNRSVGKPSDTIQWRLAKHCVKLFLHNARQVSPNAQPGICQVQSVTDHTETELTDFCFKPDPLDSFTDWDGKDIVAQQRYIVFEIRGLVVNNKKIEFQTENQTNRKVWLQIIAELLEGFVIRADNGSYSPPEFDSTYIESLGESDLGSWIKEICVFSSERSVIAYEDCVVDMAGADSEAEPHTSNERPQYSYKWYWDVILRGIEHTIAVREGLQILANETSVALSKVPNLANLAQLVVNDSTVTVSTSAPSKNYEVLRDEVNGLSQQIANLINMLAPLRKIMVTTSTFRAGYAVEKFDFLSRKALRIDTELALVERNIDELENFLMYLTAVQQRHQSFLLSKAQNEANEQQRLANEQQRKANDLDAQRNRILAIGGLVLAGVTGGFALVIGLPTFVNDFSSAAETFLQIKSKQISALLALTVWLMIALTFVITIIAIARRSNRKFKDNS